MTEDEARAYLDSHVPRETIAKIEHFVTLLRVEASGQNLIASSTLDHLWSRHIVDSAQLAALGPPQGLWLDLGSGAGLPGLVVAAVRSAPMVLIEPRTKRAAFLVEGTRAMALEDRVTIIAARAETAPVSKAAVISARAVAGLSDLFAMGRRHADRSTIWVLPKGRSAASEVALAQSSWHADIQLIPSITDSSASIVVATNVAPRRTR